MKLVLFCLFLVAIRHGAVNKQSETYADKAGFTRHKKVVISPVNDAGTSYELNAGTISALDKGTELDQRDNALRMGATFSTITTWRELMERQRKL